MEYLTYCKESFEERYNLNIVSSFDLRLQLKALFYKVDTYFELASFLSFDRNKTQKRGGILYEKPLR